ncbi:MAG TPA: sensor histidine kinase [bacterium]|nr:sensor histidine kinase [bacterium]
MVSVYRFGIRSKLLLFYAVIIVLVACVEIVTQTASFRTARGFEEELSRYHMVHRFRVAFGQHRVLTERYLRELAPEQAESVRDGLLRLRQMADDVHPVGEQKLQYFFEVQASERGLEAYARLVASAVHKRATLQGDYYTDFAKADRIAGYVDSYLSNLQSMLLENGEADFKDEVSRVSTYRVVTLALLSFAGVLSTIFALYFASSISVPIRRLADASARMAAGDLSVQPVEVATGDEIETLARSFNAMSRTVRERISDLREKALLEKRLHDEELIVLNMEHALQEAQFINLQDQIRPHFLFNALNTIARTALLEDASGTVRLAHGLGRLMRYALADTGALVPIGEELSVLREYLSFQQIRFGDRLDWVVTSISEVDGIIVPRLILQPLVENAVRHGIEPKESGGKVIVAICSRRGRILIRIVDTGVGIEPARLVALRVAMNADGQRSSTDHFGIGVANVTRRLALRYPGKALCRIVSSMGRGTVVHISIPFQHEDGADVQTADSR